jgi:DNA-binding response OmpR family regulator
MQNFDFHEIGLVIGESNRMLRRGLRSALFSKGFRDIVDTDRMSVIRDTIANQPVDLLICDSWLQDGDVVELTHDIRHNRIGNNPFIVIINFVDAPSREALGRVLNSGSDDVVLKPISAGKLLGRIEHLASQRKNFVVTGDYVGPNRRDGGRHQMTGIPEFHVPNPVRAKARGKVNPKDLQDTIEHIGMIITEEKLKRYARRIGDLVDQVVPQYRAGTPDEGVVGHLDRLLSVAGETRRCLKMTSRAHLSDLCDSLMTVAEGMRRNPLAPRAQDLSLLPQTAAAIERAFQTETAKDLH